MSLRTRLAAIERHIRELHADHRDRCPTCDGSGPGESRIVRCYLRSGEVIPKAPTCPRLWPHRGRERLGD